MIGGYDIGRITNISEEIKRAANNGMKIVTLSADIIMDRDVIESDPMRFEKYAYLAKSLGLECYFWNHCFFNVPSTFIKDGYLDFDNPELWIWLRNTYRNIFSNVPSMTGVVISFTESDWQIHRSAFEPDQSQERIITTLSPSKRLEKYILELHAELNKMGKKLIIRDFWRSNTEAGYLREALNNCPTDIMVYTKHVPNDFRYGYPVNESLGKYPERLQFLEIEPSLPAPFYYQQQCQTAHNLGVDGVIFRYRESDDEFRLLNNICLDSYLHDLYMDISPTILGQGYTNGDIEAFKGFMKTYIKANYIWNFYLGKHMSLDESKFPTRLYIGEARELYASDDQTNKIGRQIRGLTDHSYGNEAKAEKDEAITDALYYQSKATNTNLKKEFSDIANYAAIFGPAAKKFIDANYTRVKTGTDRCPLPPDSVVLKVNPNNPTSVIVTWRDNSTNELNYKLERRDDNGIMYQRALLPQNTTCYLDTSLVAGVTYTYRIRAYVNVRDSWNSPYSKDASIKLIPEEAKQD
jgi:hypothetical protein